MGIIIAIGILAIISLVTVRTFLGVVNVVGLSMYPTLKHNERLLMMRHVPVKWLKRDSIVVCLCGGERSSTSKTYPTPTLLIKRVVGLPGDILTMPERQDSYDVLQCSSLELKNDIAYRIWCVPDGHFFIKSDNIGIDSATFGPVPFTVLIGVVILRLGFLSSSEFPLSKSAINLRTEPSQDNPHQLTQHTETIEAYDPPHTGPKGN